MNATLTVTAITGGRSVWNVWVVAMLAIVGIHLSTLTKSPTIWQDEIQIVDFGRVSLAGADQSWSANWSARGLPEKPFCYIGCAMQELSYRAVGGSLAGPRGAALLGAILASGAMLGWLRARGLDGRIALACSLLFLLDPVFAQGYRGARIDAWSMGFMILGLWVIRAKLMNASTGGWKWTPRAGHAMAAVCVALSGAFWVSAMLLVPLLIHELLCDRETDQPGSGWQYWSPRLRDLIWVGSLSLVAFVVIMLPMWLENRQALSGLVASTASASGGGFSNREALAALAGAFKYNPWILLIGCVCCLSRKRWPLALALALAFAGALYTGFYIHRAVYLLPYLVLSIALAADHLVRANAPKLNRRLAGYAMAAMLVWSACITLGARTVVALKQREARDHQRLLDLATRVIGPGEYRVYLGSLEVYYAGRQSGWKIFKIFPDVPPGDGIWNGLLKTMDFAIYRINQVSSQEDEALRALGFSRQRFDCGERNPGDAPNKLNLASGYGAYWIYRKK